MSDFDNSNRFFKSYLNRDTKLNTQNNKSVSIISNVKINKNNKIENNIHEKDINLHNYGYFDKIHNQNVKDKEDTKPVKKCVIPNRIDEKVKINDEKTLNRYKTYVNLKQESIKNDNLVKKKGFFEKSNINKNIDHLKSNIFNSGSKSNYDENKITYKALNVLYTDTPSNFVSSKNTKSKKINFIYNSSAFEQLNQSQTINEFNKNRNLKRLYAVDNYLGSQSVTNLIKTSKNKTDDFCYKNKINMNEPSFVSNFDGKIKKFAFTHHLKNL
jgi:hypothetical protein